MKPIHFFILIIICFASSAVYTQTRGGSGFYSGGHDSLLFDGSNSTFVIGGNDCRVKVTNVSGIATGTRCATKVYDVCGKKDSAEVCKEGQIFPDDRLKASDKISTGPNGYLTIMLSDGKTIRFGHNTSITINSNYCDNNFQTQVQLDEGELYINAKPNNNIKGINVITKYGSALTEGTEFSYEIIKEGDLTTDVLKVYDGTVKFQKNLQNKSSSDKSKDKADAMKKLTEDFQNGKISIEEYTKKMKEITQDLKETLSTDAVTVNAGFLSRIAGTESPTAPESFDVNENRWWEKE